MFVIVIARHLVNDHTKITQPHQLFKYLNGSKHNLRFVGCGWVDAYEDVLTYISHKTRRPTFNNFSAFARKAKLINLSLELILQEYECVTLLLQGRYEDLEPKAIPEFQANAQAFDELRQKCLEVLWKSLAKCSILSLYLDADSTKRIPSNFGQLTRARVTYIITAFQNNNIPSMLHCSLEKRLVEQQIEKFKEFHKARYPPKQTTYADDGWNNPERQALLTSQRLFYVDMILNKIELAKWSLNEMWGSQAMNNAAEKANVDAAIIADNGLHKLSIEMLRCATSWLIFARHYSAEMDRIGDRPQPAQQPQQDRQAEQIKKPAGPNANSSRRSRRRQRGRDTQDKQESDESKEDEADENAIHDDNQVKIEELTKLMYKKAFADDLDSDEEGQFKFLKAFYQKENQKTLKDIEDDISAEATERVKHLYALKTNNAEQQNELKNLKKFLGITDITYGKAEKKAQAEKKAEEKAQAETEKKETEQKLQVKIEKMEHMIVTFRQDLKKIHDDRINGKRITPETEEYENYLQAVLEQTQNYLKEYLEEKQRVASEQEKT